jgi:hypothetical protein
MQNVPYKKNREKALLAYLVTIASSGSKYPRHSFN